MITGCSRTTVRTITRGSSFHTDVGFVRATLADVGAEADNVSGMMPPIEPRVTTILIPVPSPADTLNASNEVMNTSEATKTDNFFEKFMFPLESIARNHS